jgi:hypothetical protein
MNRSLDRSGRLVGKRATGLTSPSHEPPHKSEALAALRFGLGMAQMFGAVVGFVLLVEIGATETTLVVVLLTTLLSLVSTLIFRRAAPRASHHARRRLPTA